MSLNHLIESINRARAFTEPFHFLSFENAFSEDDYKALLDSIPSVELFHNISHPDSITADGDYTRSVFQLNSSNLEILLVPKRIVWEKVRTTLHSPVLRRCIFNHLSPSISTRLGISIEDASTLIAYPRTGITRDLQGFHIGVHPDWPTKIVTVQFYLPRDRNRQGLGTHFYYDPVTPSLTPLFRPNTGYAFPVNGNSWHSRDSLPPLLEPRFTIALTYFLEPPSDYADEEY